MVCSSSGETISISTTAAPIVMLGLLWSFLILIIFVQADWITESPLLSMTKVHREASLLASEDWLPSLEIFDDLFSDSVKALDGPPPFEAQLHGTTTLSFKHQDSIILCVDSKASLGNYVGSRTVKKIFPISSTVVATMAGGAADCAHLIGRVRENVKLLERQYSVTLGVQGIAKLLANVLRRNRGLGLSVGTMVAGYDDKGPSSK